MPKRQAKRITSPPRERREPGFRGRVYEVVRRIPRGRVATYGQVSVLAGHPRRARHVGQALAAVPPGLVIPWHRVINAQGRISPRSPGRGERGETARGPDRPRGEAERRQRRLLEREGVRFEKGRVDFARYRWSPATDHD